MDLLRLFLYIVGRLWSVVVGCLMIALSLVFQLLFFLLIDLSIGYTLLPNVNSRTIFIALFVIFNSVSFFEYFRRRRAVALRNSVSSWAGTVMPNGRHGAMAIFLLPRGIDRIITGRELTE